MDIAGKTGRKERETVGQLSTAFYGTVGQKISRWVWTKGRSEVQGVVGSLQGIESDSCHNTAVRHPMSKPGPWIHDKENRPGFGYLQGLGVSNRSNDSMTVGHQSIVPSVTPPAALSPESLN